MPNDSHPVVQVRPALEGDLDAVLAIERSAFSTPWSRKAFADLLRFPATLFVVADAGDEGAIARGVGYAVAYVAADEGELANIAVSREHQGRGVGRAVLRHVMAACRTRGARYLYLDVRASNTVAQALYTSAGFELVRRRARYYTKPVEDALVLRCVLD